VNILTSWLNDLWDWFWYYRRGKIKYKVWDYVYEYKAISSNGKIVVWNCYGSTPEKAKEMAQFKLNKAIVELGIK
jgi:hypothetical protein